MAWPCRPFESFKDDSSFILPNLDVFPDVEKPGTELPLPMDLVDTEELLMDLETILPDIDSPPQSPPRLTELDELLQLRAEALPDPEEFDDLLMPPTPSDSYASSPGPHSSPSYAPSTPASIYSDSSNDPEWVPEPMPGPSKTKRKPYSRVKRPIDRAERKKLQNKNAATRYRNKKKVEEDELLTQEADLAARNKELRDQVSEIETEMRIVKDLLRNKFKRMGLLK
ncbi:activating transcription factor of chaperone isoform X2 [Neocloeon triangulifer]|uniref:activating transcription factor of chaperone isoform X2 n=1 Tax=Neocloeon triangulifer TaxID=2078957 RepID=UPI00286FA429|nr:activating transcription factor of chaperone isoform X2 [Neocloeon triangulifer]